VKTVVIESPFEGGTPREGDNVLYLRKCLLDSLRRGEAPFASHAIYPYVLDDTNVVERALGIEAGLSIAVRLDAWVFYLDRGVTRGMLLGFERALGRRMDLPTLRATTIFRAFSFSVAAKSFDMDPVDVMQKHPELAEVVLGFRCARGLAEAWKIGQGSG